MGTPYASAVGNPPVCTTLAFYGWLVRYLNFRLNECPLFRTTVYFVAKATVTGGRVPSDSNDGRDGLGLNLSGQTYTASTRTVTKPSSSYAASAWGDGIYLSAGVPAGLYKIASSTATTLVLAANSDPTKGTLAAPLSDATGVSSSTGPLSTLATGVAGKMASNCTFLLNRGDIWRATLLT